MGRRHSIAARKAAGDAKKSQNYAKIGRIIQIAAKKGTDPKMNPDLELALSKARYYGLPRDVIDKAVLKGAGQLAGENLEEVTYEGYGPAGVAVLIQVLTSNTNRSASNIKLIMYKGNGNLGQQGSVAWQFKETGVIIIDGTSEKLMDKGKEVEKIHPLNPSELEEKVLELPISDIEIDGGTAIIYTDKSNFATVRAEIEKAGFHITDADIQYLPENEVEVADEEDKKRVYNLIDMLEEDEDVQKVYCNMKE